MGETEKRHMSEFENTETAVNTNADSGVVVQEWDQTDDPVRSVIDAVAQATDTEPNDLPLLYDVIDPDALKALLGADEPAERDRTAISVTFVYAGCEVAVEATGRTVVAPLDDG